MKIGTKTEHFRQSLSSQNIRNDVSEHQDFQNFLGEALFPTPLVTCAFGVCVIHQCRLKKLPIFLLKKVGHSEKENRVIDAWHEIQYYLPHAITVMCKRNIYIISNQFIVVKHVHVQCRAPFMSPL